MRSRLLSAVAAAVGFAFCVPASATLTLTPAGVALGFSATTFASGLPSLFTEGPFGLALTGNGNVLVSDFVNATRYVFADVDGQVPASALSSTPSSSVAAGYASGVGAAYGGDAGNFVKFNDDGTVASILVPTVFPQFGMAANPVTGHLIATSSAGLIDIDPVADTFRVILASIGPSADGVSLSPDGSIAYVGFFNTGHVIGYHVSDGSVAFDSGNIGHFPDGTGVIVSNNALNGKIVVNGEDGNLLLIDPNGTPGNFTIIGSVAGQRGDYVAADRSNGTLLLDYSTEVDRLSCGADCAIGGTPAVPEPSTWALLLVGLGWVTALARRVRRRSAPAPRRSLR